jgi:ACS family hexuronate transporter-like MFS transporter
VARAAARVLLAAIALPQGRAVAKTTRATSAMSQPPLPAGGAPLSAGAGTSTWRWSIVGMLFLATVLNYMDRQTISLTGKMIQDEFGLNDEQFGELTAAFLWAYGALHVPAGYIIDRFSVRWFYAAAVAVWSIAGAAAFFVRSPLALYRTRIALGLGEAFNWPCALRITGNILPRRDQGLGNGIFNSGAAIGALIAPMTIAPIAAAWGWRAAFLIVGGAGVVWVAGWLAMTGPAGSPVSVETPAGARRAERPPFLQELGKILSSPGFWILLIGASTINPCWYFIAFWSTKYFIFEFKLTDLVAAQMTIAIFLMADLGNIGGGGLVKYLVSRGRTVPAARETTVLLGATLPLAALFVNYAQTPVVAMLLIAIAAYGVTSLMTSLLACYQEVSYANIGLVMGLLGASGCVTGALTNPQIGRYIDTTKTYDLMFDLLAVVPALTTAAILLFQYVNKKTHAEQ